MIKRRRRLQVKLRLTALSVIIVCAVFSVSVMSCRHSPDLSASPQVSFSKDVQPVIVGNCTQSGCHGGEGERRPLMNYDEIASRVTPYKPHSSDLYQRITAAGSNKMPPAGYLSEQEIETIYVWIMQGAQNN